MSNVSSWLGAPRLKIRMQDLSSRSAATAPASLAASHCGSEKLSAPSVPTWRNSHRLAFASQV
jgi:hypothetical protein